MFFTNSALRNPMANPLVKCDCTSMMKYSLLGYFSAIASSSYVSIVFHFPVIAVDLI